MHFAQKFRESSINLEWYFLEQKALLIPFTWLGIRYGNSIERDVDK